MAGPRKATVRGLVDRIGGPDRLRAILEDFYVRLAADPMVGFFFADRDLETIVNGQHAFLMRAFGAAEHFTGRHPGVAHTKLPPILQGHFDRRLRVLEQTLEDQGLDAVDVAAWLRLEESFRGVVQATSSR